MDSSGRELSKWLEFSVGEEFSVFELFATATQSVCGASFTENAKQAKIWEFQGDTLVEQFLLRGHSTAIQSLAVSQDASLLATGAQDGSAILWRCRDGVPLGELETAFSAVSALAFARDQQCLASGHSDGQARIWDVASRELLQTAGREEAGWDRKAWRSGEAQASARWEAKLALRFMTFLIVPLF
ncbi:MAG: hypothetical protein AAFY15_07115 [Cyanobacteria bacterium J06648_11]